MRKFMQFLGWWLAMALVILGIVNWLPAAWNWFTQIIFAYALWIALGVFILGILVVLGSWILDWGKG